MKTTERATQGNLAAVLPRLPHHIEMINRTINGGYPHKLGVPLVDALERDLTRFKNVISPLVSAEDQPSLYEALASVESPLATLRNYFNVPDATNMSQADGQILVDFIYDRIRELRTIAADINAVYTWQSGFDYILNPVGVEKHMG